MRKQTNRSRFSVAIAAALGILGMTLATPALAVASPVAVVSTSVSGGVVNVTVRNSSFLPQAAMVSVQAVVNDTAVWSFAPVLLLPGQTTVVHAGFTANVSGVARVGISCGIVDGGDPY
jgi:hypothetical protein